MDLNKLVVLNSEEEYYDWLLERQLTGIILLAVANVLMLGFYVGAHIAANPLSSVVSAVSGVSGVLGGLSGGTSGILSVIGNVLNPISNVVNAVVGNKNATLYAVIPAGISVAIAIVADVITFIGHEDMEAWAESAYYLQLVQAILTNLTVGMGILAVALLGFLNLIPALLVGAGVFLGLCLGIPGAILVIASEGLWNYTRDGVEGEFDGDEIIDEVALSISY